MTDRREAVGASPTGPAPLVFAGAFVLGLVLNSFVPHLRLAPVIRVAGLALVAVGLFGIGFPALAALRRAGTSPNPRRPTTALVVTGPYRFTRHPLYLSMAVVYAGAALAANVVWVLVLLPFAMATVQRGSMMREERYMEEKFGDEYRAYAAGARRWI